MNSLFKIASLVFVSLLVLMSQGCVSTNNASDNVLSHIVIAEPMQVNYKSEVAIARLTDVIQRADITDAQRAQLFYDRGVIFDSVGLRSLARLDFNRAINLKPDLTDAYNFIGIHYTQLQEYTQAYDAFDSAIDLAPNHEYAYLNRGIALYYGGRPQLAADDFSHFHQNKADDPYRLLWLYLAEQKVDPVLAKNNLKARSQVVHENMWAKQIIKLYVGEINENTFITDLTLGVRNNKELTDRLCEAYFYLGKFYQIRNNDNAAENYFKLALSTNVYEFVEHRYAKLELDLMRDIIVGPALESDTQ